MNNLGAPDWTEAAPLDNLCADQSQGLVQRTQRRRGIGRRFGLGSVVGSAYRMVKLVQDSTGEAQAASCWSEVDGPGPPKQLIPGCRCIGGDYGDAKAACFGEYTWESLVERWVYQHIGPFQEGSWGTRRPRHPHSVLESPSRREIS